VPAAGTSEDDPRVYLAVERTFLAWIRTGLGMMGVGFAVARFGLFLREMRAAQTHSVPVGGGWSVASGVTIVMLGVLVLSASAIRHVSLVRELRTGTWEPGRISRNGMWLAVVLAVVGLGMASYLLAVR
jgi:putative membrane protein